MTAAPFDRRGIIKLPLDADGDIDPVDAAAARALMQGNEALAEWLSMHRTQQPLP